MKKTTVGGQAVIEGVMMRGLKGIATAVRLTDGSIDVKMEESTSLTKKNKFFGLPIIRGFVSLIESLIIGIKSIEYSASFFENENEEESKFDKWFQNTFKDKANNILMGISLVLSLVLSVALFFILPTLLASAVKKFITSNVIVLNIMEGIIRVIIFLSYVFFIGKLEDINRLYQYHGAEHKTIF